MTVVGSHATGGGSVSTNNGSGASHGRHSPPGTPVPYLRLESDRRRATTTTSRRKWKSPVDDVDLFARFGTDETDQTDQTDEEKSRSTTRSRTIVPGVRWKGAPPPQTPGHLRSHGGLGGEPPSGGSRGGVPSSSSSVSRRETRSSSDVLGVVLQRFVVVFVVRVRALLPHRRRDGLMF